MTTPLSTGAIRRALELLDGGSQEFEDCRTGKCGDVGCIMTRDAHAELAALLSEVERLRGSEQEAIRLFGHLGLTTINEITMAQSLDCGLHEINAMQEEVADLKRKNEHLIFALAKLRSYNQDIRDGMINYRPEDHIAVIDLVIGERKLEDSVNTLQSEPICTCGHHRDVHEIEPPYSCNEDALGTVYDGKSPYSGCSCEGFTYPSKLKDNFSVNTQGSDAVIDAPEPLGTCDRDSTPHEFIEAKVAFYFSHACINWRQLS